MSRNNETILIVDDSPETRLLLKRTLSARGFTTHGAESAAEAVALLNQTDVDLVITDLRMPGASGMDLVRHIRENLLGTEVMMITGYATVEGAVEAVKTGAEEYLAKPFTDEELFAAVDRVLEKLRLRRSLERGGEGAGRFGILGESEAMREVFRVIDKAAATKATVLITGESGTGKELVARAVHYNSPRAKAAFVPVNCGGIPEGLLESELFGYVKGAFTGAAETRAGFFQTAEGGTIFLDEISETSPAMQVKLLRVLQEREVAMVGQSRGRPVDIRVLAATNTNLRRLVERGQFREDLFYRLNVIALELPPLRKRGNDVLLLARHFARRYAGEFDRPLPLFTDRALEVLLGYSWPGNVRELENLIQRLMVMSEPRRKDDRAVIDAGDLPEHLRYCVNAARGVERSLAEVEAEHIQRVLEARGGNKTRAAAVLGIDRKTLREKIKRYDIPD